MLFQRYGYKIIPWSNEKETNKGFEIEGKPG
ncbi:MAG: hypothetical protein ACJAR1_002485 [Rubritalea sp.]|jgi:hypothetical protein